MQRLPRKGYCHWKLKETYTAIFMVIYQIKVLAKTKLKKNQSKLPLAPTCLYGIQFPGVDGKSGE